MGIKSFSVSRIRTSAIKRSIATPTDKFSIQNLWDFLLEQGTLASCIPGAEKVETIDDKTYECIVKQSVGPISVKLKFTAVLAEVDSPKHYAERLASQFQSFGSEAYKRLAQVLEDDSQVKVDD